MNSIENSQQTLENFAFRLFIIHFILVLNYNSFQNFTKFPQIINCLQIAEFLLNFY
jgi:hypothetical protein